jgi:hypothetical protein
MSAANLPQFLVYGQGCVPSADNPMISKFGGRVISAMGIVYKQEDNGEPETYKKSIYCDYCLLV